jgi:hypothetical protein
LLRIFRDVFDALAEDDIHDQSRRAISPIPLVLGIAEVLA